MSSSLSVETGEGAQVDRSLDDHPSKKQIRWVLLLVYMTLIAVGGIGGPLLQRLYYLHGGSRKWLASCLQTLGFPIMFIPLSYLYLRSRAEGTLKSFFIQRKLIMASASLGLLLGLDNYMYAVGLSYIPVSTSSLLFSTQLAFTAVFAFVMVRQRFSFYSLNSVVLLTLGAIVLALRTSSDRPPGVSRGNYLLGFFLTLGGAMLLGFILPSIELSYMKSAQAVSYPVVMQFQVIFTFSATVFSLIGMAINKDFEAISREGKAYELGELKYYVVVVSSAFVWQFLFVGTLGVVYCSSSLFAGIISAFVLPFTPVAAVIAFDEKFTGEKGMSLALCLWGFTSYFVGEYKKSKKKTPISDSSEPNVV